MGLAASQARFLGITARKSNIEYEGQQVNQQRTVLSQEVSDLYNQLMQLDKPIQPVQSDFYETHYTFSLSSVAGQEEYTGDYTLNSYVKQGDKYILDVTRSYKRDEIRTDLLSNTSCKFEKKSDEEDKYIFTDENHNEFTLTKLTEEESKDALALIDRDCTDAQKPQGKYLYIYSNGTDVRYFDSETVEKFEAGKTNIYEYNKLANQPAEENKTLYASDAVFDEYGNLKNFKDIYALKHDEETGKDDKIALSTETSVDVFKSLNEERMEAAMRNYTLQVDEYNQEYARLNAKTEDLQQQDKVLELRLDQIDTEEQELSTELEAVKKVIEKNIENTFKTFA